MGPELAHAQYTLAGAPEVAWAPAILRRASVSLRPQLGLSWWFRNAGEKGDFPGSLVVVFSLYVINCLVLTFFSTGCSALCFRLVLLCIISSQKHLPN